MALTADELDQAARGTVDLYQAAEEAILTQVTRRLAAGQSATDWQAQRLGQLSSLRRSVQRILDATEAEGAPRIRQTVADAWRTGTGRATVGLPARLLPGDPDAVAAALARPPIRVDAVESLAGELASDITSRHANVLRHVEDVYRSTIQQAAAVSIAGGQTRLQAAQHAYQQFVDQGVTSFVDVSGRRWRLSSYAEMAVRTVTQRAAVQGQTDRLQDLGLDLVIISDSPRECPLCRRWEGAVLSVSGRTPAGRIEMDNVAGPGTVEVTVDGTLDEARRAGLFHPNCTHSARGYLPGVTRRQPAQANPEGDQAQQRQRGIERKIRGWKERAAGALEPAAAAAARRKVRSWQREMRDHLDTNPELKRLRYRERPGAGNIPPTAAGIRDIPTPPQPPRVPDAALPFHRDLAGVEDLALAVDRGEVRDRVALTGGVSAETELVTLADDTKVVHKSGGNAEAEQAASMIGRALGLRAPRVYRDHPSAVWMEYVDDAATAERLQTLDAAEWRRRRAAADKRDEQVLVGLLDALTGNVDRHAGNWMLTSSGEVIPIDHGHTFAAARQTPRRITASGEFVERFQYGDNPLTLADVDEVRTRLEALRPDFDHIGRAGWLDYALSVLELVARRASGTRNLIAR